MKVVNTPKVLILLALCLLHTTSSLPRDELDEISIDDLGSLNNMDLFKNSLSLFGVDRSSSSEEKPMSSSERLNFPAEFIDYNFKTAPGLITGKPLRAQLWLFLSKKNGDFERYLPQLEDLLEDFRGQLIFITCNVDDRGLKGTLDSVRVRQRESPTMRIIFIGPEAMDIYKPKDDALTAENVETFAQKYLLKRLIPLPAGQMLPDDWDQRPVKMLVAENIIDFIDGAKDKRVVVKYYSPNCPACVTFGETFQRAARDFDGSENLVLAEFDITQNELSDRIMILPTMKIYENGVIVHESNGLGYEELVGVLRDPNLGKRTEKKSEDLDFDL